jgi:hypothetical protein
MIVLSTRQPGFDSRQGKCVQTDFEAYLVACPGLQLVPEDEGSYSSTIHQTTECLNPEDCNMTKRSLSHAFYLSVNCSQVLVDVSEKE